MLHLILADINAGRSVLVLDPKADLINDLLMRIPGQLSKFIKYRGDLLSFLGIPQSLKLFPKGAQCYAVFNLACNSAPEVLIRQ